MPLETTNILTVSPETKASQLGGFVKSGGIATLDEYSVMADGSVQTFKWIGVGTGGGAVVVEGVDGNPIYIPALPAGAWRPVLGRRILTGATVNGTSVTTTATLVTVYGGE